MKRAVLLLCLCAVPALAKHKPDLAESLESTIPRVAGALEHTSAEDFPLSQWSDRPFALSLFMLRVRGKFGFEIPGLTLAELQPEVELVWERCTEAAP